VPSLGARSGGEIPPGFHPQGERAGGADCEHERGCGQFLRATGRNGAAERQEEWGRFASPRLCPGEYGAQVGACGAQCALARLVCGLRAAYLFALELRTAPKGVHSRKASRPRAGAEREAAKHGAPALACAERAAAKHGAPAPACVQRAAGYRRRPLVYCQ
jgi:hypothetical protein